MATWILEIIATWKFKIKSDYLEIRNKNMAIWKLEIERWLSGNQKQKDGYLEIRNKNMTTWKWN